MSVCLFVCLSVCMYVCLSVFVVWITFKLYETGFAEGWAWPKKALIRFLWQFGVFRGLWIIIQAGFFCHVEQVARLLCA